MLLIIIVIILISYMYVHSYYKRKYDFQILQTDLNHLSNFHINEKYPLVIEDNIKNLDYFIKLALKFKYIKITEPNDIYNKQLVTLCRFTLIHCIQEDPVYILCNIPRKKELYEIFSKEFNSVRDDRIRKTDEYVHVKLYAGQIFIIPPHWECIIPEKGTHVACLQGVTGLLLNMF